MQIRSDDFTCLFSKISTLLIFVAIMTSCGSSPPVQQTANTLQTPSENSLQSLKTPGQVVASYITARSISELTSKATLIVIGQVEQDTHSINMARDVNDINKPDLSLLGLGQVYGVKVESIIKGTAPGSTVWFVQPEGFLVKPQTSIEPLPEDVKLAHQNYRYIPFTSGHRYLLFLHPLRGFEQQQYFTGGVHPWRFDATDENNVYPESPALIDIRPAPLAEIIKQIETSPTPVPTVISPLPTPSPVATVKAAP